MNNLRPDESLQDVITFTNDSFDKSQWENVKVGISLINSQAANWQDLVPYSRILLKLLSGVIISSDYKQYFGEESIKEFFFNDFFKKTFDEIINFRRDRENRELEEVLNNCVYQFTLLWIKVFPPDFISITEIAKNILEPGNPFWIFTKSSWIVKSFPKDQNNQVIPETQDTKDAPSCCFNNLKMKEGFAMNKTKSCNFDFISLMNSFGSAGGFDRIYERVIDSKNRISIKAVSLLCSIFCNLISVLSEEFMQNFFPKLKEGIFINLRENPDSKNGILTKQILSDIMKCLEKMFRVIGMHEDIKETLKAYCFEISEVCMSSENLEAQIQGLFILIKTVKTSNHADIQDFFIKSDIFNRLFSSKSDPALIKRSNCIFRYMLQHELLDLKHFEILWERLNQGKTKLAFFQLLSSPSADLKHEYLDYLIERLSNTPPKDLAEEDIKLAFDLCKLRQNSTEFFMKTFYFFWRIVAINQDDFSSAVSNRTKTVFRALIKDPKFKIDEITILNDCIENIKKRIKVFDSITLMKKLIKRFPQTFLGKSKYSRESLAYHLYKDKNLPHALIKELKSFKSSVLEKIADQSEITEELLNSLMSSRSTYETEIKTRMNLLVLVLKTNMCIVGILNYELLCDLWGSLVETALSPFERSLGLKFFTVTLNHTSGTKVEHADIVQFFRDKINNSNFLISKTMNEESYECFKHIFLLANPNFSVNFVRVSLSKTIGIDGIWNFILNTQDDKVSKNALELLRMVYSHINYEFRYINTSTEIEKCMQILKEATRNQEIHKDILMRECLRCLDLINLFVDESEKKGIGALLAHSRPKKSYPITLFIKPDGLKSYFSNRLLTQDYLKLDSNATVFDLLVEFGNKYKYAWDEISLAKESKSCAIKENHYGKTLGEIGFKDTEILIIYKRHIYGEILLRDDGAFNPIAKEIFIELFNKFSDGGKMSPETYNYFIFSCTYGVYQPDDTRATEIFAKYDDDRDGYLTLDNFLALYHETCKNRSSSVYQNLNAFGYRNDLKKPQDVRHEKADLNFVMRYIISNNQEYFQLLYSLLDMNEKVASKVWNLLSRMSTNPKIFADFVRMKDIREAQGTNNRDWNQLLDPKSKFKFLYCLYIVDLLVDENKSDREKEHIEQMLRSQEPKLLEYLDTWRTQFIVYGGFEHLFKAFEIYAVEDSENFDALCLNIISLTLKILKTTLEAQDLAVDSSSKNIIYITLNLIEKKINGLFGVNLSCTLEEEFVYFEKINALWTAILTENIEEDKEFQSILTKIKSKLDQNVQPANIKDLINVAINIFLWKRPT